MRFLIGVFVCLAFLLGLPVAAQTQDTLLATDAASGAKVYVRRASDKIVFSTVGPTNIYISFDFDVNANGAADRNIDVAYSFPRAGGVCSQYRLTEESWTYCGVFRSAATTTQQTVGTTFIATLSVPVAELSRDGKRFGYRVTIWDDTTKRRSYQTGTYSLAGAGSAIATAAPVPAPRPAEAAATASPVPAECKVVWRTVRDGVAGATYEMGRAPERSYFINYRDKFPSSSNEEELFTERDDCGSFSAVVWSLGNNQVADPSGFLNAYQSNLSKGLNGVKIESSRDRTIDGYPAREIRSSFLSDYDRSRVYNKDLVVLRGNRVLIFSAMWQGREAVPPKVARSFASIRLTQEPPLVHLTTFALLEEAITKYWMFPSQSYRYTEYFSTPLLARLEQRREADSRTVDGFGYPREFTVVSQNGATKVVRVRHDSATVDWSVTDNDTVITAISWTRR